MKIKNNQSGIAHLAAILAVVVIVAIGVVGWKVWSNKDSKANNEASTTAAQPIDKEMEETKTKPVEDKSPEGWTKYDSNENFSFIYPDEWKSVVKITEYPTSEVFKIRYVGEIKLNKQLDGWVHATTDNGATVGAKADVIKEKTDSKITIWRFGFGDAGYGSFIPTFTTSGKVYQITTKSFCPDTEKDCLSIDAYNADYSKLIDSIEEK